MSINVNVSGNPVRINRGTLIGADPDYAKKEFDKRRRMRLEQVRHQSKEIAENVRSKVRKEKEKQLTDFEKREEDKLKKWQNRKLLELQQQYCESLKEIGLGHAQAVVENTQDEIEEEHREKQKEKAKERGQHAKQQLQADTNKKNLKKAVPLQRKKFTRDIENVRSAMVSKNVKSPVAKKRKKRKSNNTNINITTNISSDSLSESNIEELDITNDDYNYTPSERTESGGRRKRSKSPTISPTSISYASSSPKSGKKSPPRRVSPTRPKSPLIPVPIEIEEYPLDTRISDRIKHRRHLLRPQKDVSEPFSQRILPDDRITLESQVRTFIPVQRMADKTTSMTECDQRCGTTRSCDCKCPYCNHTLDKNEIPVKPTVSLKDVVRKSEEDGSKVQYYDHNNRFSKQYIEKRPSVKKISDENIQVCVCPWNENEYVDKMFRNDQDAEIRGRKALEKVNVQKDYQEMLKQLPVLEKQERIATLSGDKQTFHMDSDRLREYEKNKQNQMENVYERHFPKTITIPPKKYIVEEEPFKTVEVSQSNPVLNAAEWDVDPKNGEGFTLTKKCGDIVIETDLNTTNKEDYLKYLLERLKLQKEMLLREAAALPQNSNLNSILNDLENLQSKEGSPRNLITEDGCPCPLPDVEEIKSDDRKSTTHKRARQSAVSTSNSSMSSTPSKKRKHKKHKIILQNTSTQTSPKTIVSEGEHLSRRSSPRRISPIKCKAKCALPQEVIKVSRPTSPVSGLQGKDQASSPINLQPVKTIRSKCKCKPIDDPKRVCKCKQYTEGEVCEILIKIKENDEPEIRIKSPTKPTKSVIVKELSEDTSKTKLPSKRVVKINDKPSNKVRTSWRDQLSRNEIAGTSTSTSYFSPPDFSKSDFSRGPQAESTGTRPSCYSTDTTCSRKKIDVRLLKYIKKLLTMSRHSVEDLGVSSVSDVSTPSASVFNNSRNDSLNQLRNVIKYFNINPDDLAYYLNYSDTSGSGVDPNYSTTPSTVHSCSYEGNKSRLNNNNASTSQDSAKSVSPRRGEESIPTPLSRYADLAELCEKRISDLTDMIKKVRMEKQQILSPSPSDKENSTQYMGLPAQLNTTREDLEQAEINRKILEIDYNLAERMRAAAQQRMSQPNSPVEMNEMEKELVERYRRLIAVRVQISDDDKTMTSTKIETASTSFKPLAMNIPKLPKLEFNLENQSEKHSKPPPAKGLIAAKRFNIDISNLPHELSTIAEVDSQVSTRIRANSKSPIRTFDNLNPVIVLPEFPTEWVKQTKQSEGSMPDIVAEIAVNTEDVTKRDRGVQIQEKPVIIPLKPVDNLINITPKVNEHSTTDSSTEDKSGMDNIESMLKSMGMGWAVSTLRKTKAAELKASSSTSTTSKEQSSSSIDDNSKLPTSSSSSSDITLRDILGKKLFTNSTNTSSLSQSISPSLKKAINDLSTIYGSGRSTENKNQRTSTPIQTTKSSESKKELYTADSELSTVKLSDDYLTMRDTTDNNSDV